MTRGLLIALDVLVVALLVTAAVQPSPSVEPWATIAVGVAFGLVYARGRTAIRLDDVPGVTGRGAWWPAGAWMLGLGLIWVALLATSTAGLWIAFPLMLLQMHVLGPHRGTLAVAGTTMLAVGAGLLQKSAADPAIGFVLGPVLGGGVADRKSVV